MSSRRSQALAAPLFLLALSACGAEDRRARTPDDETAGAMAAPLPADSAHPGNAVPRRSTGSAGAPLSIPAAQARVSPGGGSTSGTPSVQVGHVRGAEDAALMVVEFSDFGCTSCADFARETLPALRREFVETGRVRWRFVPIRQGFFRGAEAARAAECAAEQGLFWPMHDLLLAHQRDWQQVSDPAAAFAAYARASGADPGSFATCHSSARPERRLRRNDIAALSLGIRGIPVFLVGNQRVIGALEPERFAAILRAQLAASSPP